MGDTGSLTIGLLLIFMGLQILVYSSNKCRCSAPT